MLELAGVDRRNAVPQSLIRDLRRVRGIRVRGNVTPAIAGFDVGRVGRISRFMRHRSVGQNSVVVSAGQTP